MVLAEQCLACGGRSLSCVMNEFMLLRVPLEGGWLAALMWGLLECHQHFKEAMAVWLPWPVHLALCGRAAILGVCSLKLLAS